jgi:large subunit ribosomal protein L18
MKGIAIKQEKLARRHGKIRSRVVGTAQRPRLSVYKSNKYIIAQLIDDAKGATIIAGNTKDFAKKGNKVDTAKLLGSDLATRAKAAGITAVVFDRGGFRYTGRIAALAKAAREGGLVF